MPLNWSMFTPEGLSGDDFLDDVDAYVVDARFQAFLDFKTGGREIKKCFMVFDVRVAEGQGYDPTKIYQLKWSMGSIELIKPGYLKDGVVHAVDTSHNVKENNERLVGLYAWTNGEKVNGKAYGHLIESLQKAGFELPDGIDGPPNVRTAFANRLNAHWVIKKYDTVLSNGDKTEMKVHEVTKLYDSPGSQPSDELSEKVVKGLQDLLPVRLEDLVSKIMSLDLPAEEAERAQSLITEDWVGRHLTIDGDNITAAA